MGLAPFTGQALPWSSELRDQQQNWLSDLRRQSASGQTDRQKQGDQSVRDGDTTAQDGREVVEETEILKAKREEFKGLREQMANCTRVSQPGSKSVLCIRMGEEEGRERGGSGDEKWPWRKLDGAIRPWVRATGRRLCAAERACLSSALLPPAHSSTIGRSESREEETRRALHEITSKPSNTRTMNKVNVASFSMNGVTTCMWRLWERPCWRAAMSWKVRKWRKN